MSYIDIREADVDREDLRYAQEAMLTAKQQAVAMRDSIEPLVSPTLYGALTHIIESVNEADPLIDKMRATVTVAHLMHSRT